MPTEESLVRLPTLCYDNLNKLDEKNWGLVFVCFFFITFPLLRSDRLDWVFTQRLWPVKSSCQAILGGFWFDERSFIGGLHNL